MSSTVQPVVADRPDQLDQGGLLARIEPGGRLVRGRAVWLGGQCSRDLGGAAGRRRVRFWPSPRRGGDPDELQQRGGLLDGAVPSRRCRGERRTAPGTDVRCRASVATTTFSKRRHLAPQPNVLERPGDPAAGDLMTFDPAQRLTVEGHRTDAGR